MSLIRIAAAGAGLALSVVANGCYQTVGEPPVSRSSRLVDLSDADYLEVCEWVAAAEGYPPERSEACSRDGIEFVRGVTIPSVCLEFRLSRETDPTCAATVGQLEECVRAVDGMLCRTGLPECRWPDCPRGIVP